jgi:hypothetical protein
MREGDDAEWAVLTSARIDKALARNLVKTDHIIVELAME